MRLSLLNMDELFTYVDELVVLVLLYVVEEAVAELPHSVGAGEGYFLPVHSDLI